MAIDNSNNESVFSSISECSRILHINRAKIKECLISGGAQAILKKKIAGAASPRLPPPPLQLVVELIESST